ncbi:MAG TPA: hypothetical protein VIL87_05920 [Dermatophilaceae bacterium]
MASRASIRSSLKVISIPSSSVGAKLQPQRIRASLSFAGLYQITHEMIKQSVLEEVRLFYRQGFDETGWQYDEEEYKRRVLSGAPKDRFRASLVWLGESEAIRLGQADRLHAVYAHRHGGQRGDITVKEPPTRPRRRCPGGRSRRE